MSKEQKQLSKEDLTLWVNFVVTGKVEKGMEKQLNRISKREVSVGDVTTLIRALTSHHDAYISSLIEANSVLRVVMRDELNISEAQMDKALNTYKQQVGTALQKTHDAIMEKAQENVEFTEEELEVQKKLEEYDTKNKKEE
ncbi:hypothetical protein [Listeria phage LMTA-148]|uniref:Uncharacterized protein n=1 Tax=Listeria phage LMTA-148 TaxID=1486413 RepID=A0A068CAU6_9CAUD|nr:hypothetical protein LD12_gp116 [Listeria phage LMTA-148]AID17405.1 hypothetical protein [Listeria phage LMTA-148]